MRAWQWLFYVSSCPALRRAVSHAWMSSFPTTRIRAPTKLTIYYSVQIEGALTMFFAIIAALVLPDFPHNSRHFSKAELELAQLRMTEDVGTKDDTKVSNWTAFKFAMGDYKLWTMVFALTSMVISLSVSFFSFVSRPSRADA